MNPLDQPLHACHALVVDGQPISRSTLASMLRAVGVGQVSTCNRPAEAQRLIGERQFDFVLCEQRFDTGELGGQELLDELRRTRSLPFWTVFIIVTSEATYAMVTEAAESSLDGYLVKPATTAALGERLGQARRRKQALQDIFRYIDAGRLEQAALMCLKRFTDRSEYWLYAARIGGDVLLRLGKPQSARKFFEAVLEARQVPWASLGIARADADVGQIQQARRTVEQLVQEFPTFADGHDLLGRFHVDQGDFASALVTYRTACTLTPRSLTRLEKLGTLAFYTGDLAEAEEVLDRTVTLDAQSRMFDLQTLALLACLKFARGDNQGLTRMHQRLGVVQRRHPDSKRVQRLAALGDLLRHAAIADDHQSARAELQDMASQRRDDDFDVEAGSNLIALIARLKTRGVDVPETQDWGRELGLRFCVSNAATDLLCGAARGQEELQATLRQAHVDINDACEQAVRRSLIDQPEAAVQSLLLQGGETLNARVIELAGRLLQRHGAAIGAAAGDLSRQAERLRQRYCPNGTRLPITDRGREAGALALNF
ncbi:MAG: hypothetical protein RIQ60_4121 [Pseudomonadota bacterium]